MTVEKPKPKQLLRPITTGADSATNQLQFLEITCNTLKAREKSRIHGAIGFGFASHWLKNWRESFKPITKRSNRNYIITFDSHLKTALLLSLLLLLQLLLIILILLLLLLLLLNGKPFHYMLNMQLGYISYYLFSWCVGNMLCLKLISALQVNFLEEHNNNESHKPRNIPWDVQNPHPW